MDPFLVLAYTAGGLIAAVFGAYIWLRDKRDDPEYDPFGSPWGDL